MKGGISGISKLSVLSYLRLVWVRKLRLERGQCAWGMAAARLILEAWQGLTLLVTSDFPFFKLIVLIFTVLGLHCCTGFSLVMERGAALWLWCVGVSLCWLLLL